MRISNISAVRQRLNSILEEWRSGSKTPLYLGTYGTPEAVLVPIELWGRLIAAAAEAWDLRTAGARATRAGQEPARPSSLLEVARFVRVAEDLVPGRRSRGVPAGAADITLRPGAEQDLLLLAREPEVTRVAIVEGLGSVLLGRVTRVASACGHGLSYSAVDVDGLHAVVFTFLSRPASSGRPERHPTVELAAVDRLEWPTVNLGHDCPPKRRRTVAALDRANTIPG